MSIFLLLNLISLTLAAKENGQREHTKIYSSFVNSIFIVSTYIESDPCRIINSRREFIAALSEYNISDDYTGYDTEHIVDEKNTPYNGNKNILGNLIMANSTWNRQLGWLNWSMVEREKRAVYGDILDKAIYHVNNCKEEEEMDQIEDAMSLVVFISSILFIISLVGIYLYNASKYKTVEEIASREGDSKEDLVGEVIIGEGLVGSIEHRV